MAHSASDRLSTAYESLGRLLAGLRAERGLAQKEVAQRAGIDNSTLSRLESGERGVSREVLDRLSAVLELDRRQHLNLLRVAGLLTEEDARILADDDLYPLARLLTSSQISGPDSALLRVYLRLALAHAQALGYDDERSS